MEELERPKISIIVPIHDMVGGAYFMWRLIQSLATQSFKDYELIITKEGKMAENTNAGIRKARGEIIKILFMDDYFLHPDALKNIVEAFDTHYIHWLATGCVHQEEDGPLKNPHYPTYSHDIETGNNTIGSPSVIAFRREDTLFFDEKLSFLLDCDLYKRFYQNHGKPFILNDLNVVIGLGSHQTTHTMPNEEKLSEFNYLKEKKYV